jgi:HdeA/HdeB family
MMLKIVVLAAAVLATLPANAQSALDEPRQTFDLQKVTCKNFMELKTDGMGIRLIYWLDGNYRADDNTIIDTDVHKKMLVELAGYCEANPEHSVSRAAEKLFKDKK